MEIVVVGSSDFVLGFRLAGIRRAYEADKDLVTRVQSILEDRSVGILVMHQDDLEKLPSSLRNILDKSVEPTVITLGGAGESSSLREKIKQSIGVDLWK